MVSPHSLVRDSTVGQSIPTIKPHMGPTLHYPSFTITTTPP